MSSNDLTAPVFELATCTRCKGTGNHSFHPGFGTMCFGCNGTGQEMRDSGKRRPLTADELAKYEAYTAGIAACERRAAERAERQAARKAARS